MSSPSLIPFDLSDFQYLNLSALQSTVITVLALTAIGGLGLAVLARLLAMSIRRALRPHPAAPGSVPC